MKTLLLAAVLIATPAFAAELPLTGAYGTPTGCQQYLENGPEGVIYNSPVSRDDV